MNQTVSTHRLSGCPCTHSILKHSPIRIAGKKLNKPSILDTAPRFRCALPGCTTSFRRSSDLIRHEKSIHGPKQKCIYQGCKYATGRLDKLNEHTRKIHKSAATPSRSPSTSIPDSHTPYEPTNLSEPFDTSKFYTPYTKTPASSSSSASYTTINSPNIPTPIEWDLNSEAFSEDVLMDYSIYLDFQAPFYADTWSLAPADTCVVPSWDLPLGWFN